MLRNCSTNRIDKTGDYTDLHSTPETSKQFFSEELEPAFANTTKEDDAYRVRERIVLALIIWERSTVVHCATLTLFAGLLRFVFRDHRRYYLTA